MPTENGKLCKLPTIEIKEHHIPGYETVIEGKDRKSGLHCFIAIHDTTLGPALGGVRIFPYGDTLNPLEDVLRLAKGMTKKSAIAELGFGGGKSVIVADPKTDKTPELLHAFGHVLKTLKGRYIAAEDVGSSTEDMAKINEVCPYVAALQRKGSSGDPSPYTAWGVFRGIQATAHHLWNTPSLKGKRVAIQGLGHVGVNLAMHLFWAGADLILTDIDEKKLEEIAYRYGAESISPDEIHMVECDIFAPCAMGGVLTKETIPLLRCKAIAGAANNQLLHTEYADLLFERNILYAPDYIINSGGLINVSAEYESGGYNPKKSRDKVDRLYKILLNIYDKADKTKKTSCEVAEELWSHNLKKGIGKRMHPIDFGTGSL